MLRRMFLMLPSLALAPSSNDINALTRMCYGEAGNQPIAGQKAVIQVVLNRWKSRHPLFEQDHGKPLSEIVSRKGQFYGYNHCKFICKVEKEKITSLVKKAIYDWQEGFDDSGGAVWFGKGGRKPCALAKKSVRINCHQFWKLDYQA